MGFQLTDLRNMRREIEVDYFGQTGMVVYNPGAITEEMLAALRESSEDEQSLNGFIAKILLSWDVVDAKGVALPITDKGGLPAAELDTVPVPFKAAVMARIMEDVVPNQTTAASSGAGSRRRGR